MRLHTRQITDFYESSLSRPRKNQARGAQERSVMRNMRNTRHIDHLANSLDVSHLDNEGNIINKAYDFARNYLYRTECFLCL